MTAHENLFDRRLFLAAAGTLALAGQGARAQEPKRDFPRDATPAAPARPLSDTIAEFVVGFDPTSLPPIGIERARLAFIDTLAVMLAGSREEGAQMVCEMVRQEGAAAQVSVIGQRLRNSPRSPTALPPTSWITTCPRFWDSRQHRSFRRCSRLPRAQEQRPRKR